ncbi:MAG TPA: TIGR04028 family ABC transporter substrate-binding protein, partial [Pantoea agglomerans]|nr:TIGR04028 family ABC transporter substrate-binding protein [Pantoea agglomerans]
VRADPYVSQGSFYQANRHNLLQKGGASDKGKTCRDDKLKQQMGASAREVDPAKRLEVPGEEQREQLEQAYVIPIFEEPQVYAGAPWLKGVSFEAVGRPALYGAWLEKQ